MALQVLYEVDSAQHPVGEVIAARVLADPISKKAERYVNRLVKGVYDHRAELDTIIQRHAAEWPIGQVAIIDRNILRLGLFELASQPNVSVSVIIAEAMELSNLFGAEGSTRFINGVLGALAANDQDAIRKLLTPEPESED